MSPQHLIITFGTQNLFTLKFKLNTTPITQLWLDRMALTGQWPMDHPDRFYGFKNVKQEKEYAEQYIQNCINIINSHLPIIDRPFNWSQDCLNYLHNIFERYHGLLDCQDTEYWNTAPNDVKKALAELNLAVHRCETVNVGNKPRFVCTWFGMPKTLTLSDKLQTEFGETCYTFGGVYINYVEIGKTVEDLAHDQDQYISDDAFKPFNYYSADFKVVFYDEDLSLKLPDMDNYITQHSDFFIANNIKNVYNVRAMPYRFRVADVVWDGTPKQLIDNIASAQWINSVRIE